MTEMEEIVKWILIVAILLVMIMIIIALAGPMMNLGQHNPFAGMFG